jgi:mannose-1-phosphate guanylyltransferase
MFRAKFLLDEYAAFEPDSAAPIALAVDRAGSDLGFITLAAENFARAAAKSFDYAVMERTSRAAVLPVSYDWCDLGAQTGMSLVLHLRAQCFRLIVTTATWQPTNSFLPC